MVKSVRVLHIPTQIYWNSSFLSREAASTTLRRFLEDYGYRNGIYIDEDNTFSFFSTPYLNIKNLSIEEFEIIETNQNNKI